MISSPAPCMRASPRRAARPFLLDSDLAGHEKTRFTGAVAEKKGRLEVA